MIGTSLHVRIIAAAYGLPRVTMRRTKPTRYAAHWDDQMPFDVRIDDLDDAIGAALAAGTRAEVRAASERLSRLADDNVRAIAERVAELVARGSDAEREQLRRAPPAAATGTIASRREACAVVDRPAPRRAGRGARASSSVSRRGVDGCAAGLADQRVRAR